MLLRSSSTPVLGSLMPSFSESPNNLTSHHFEAKPSATLHLNNTSSNKFSIHQSLHHNNYASLSANSSPSSPSLKGFRRAQSDGNLAGLSYENKEDRMSPAASTLMRRPKSFLMMETIPSFSLRSGFAEEEEEEEEEDESDWGGVVAAVQSVGLVEEVKRVQDYKILSAGLGHQNEVVGRGLYVEKEFEIGGSGRSGGGGGGEFNSRGGGSGDGGEKQGAEQYYRRMVEENPGNSLFLGNYAQFLYQTKGDLKRAEEYYSRAILADPEDGGFLSQYAKLVWELHRDQDRALSYHERAVRASPQDCHVQAAYANFLWETEDDEDNEACLAENRHGVSENIASGFGASATT